MNAADLAETLRAHAAWLAGTGGKRADLSRADLRRAHLRRANLQGADLRGADLQDAELQRADLRYTDLRDADLQGAYLQGAYLRDADLHGATMPDGRTWEAYAADHMAGVCDDPEAVARATDAWGGNSWKSCPMHAAHGYMGFGDAPEDKRLLVGCWVALYDAGLLERPALGGESRGSGGES